MIITSKFKLINYSKDLVRGSILRCKGVMPYEDLVDFMLIETPNKQNLSYSLLVSTGYKAGLIYTKLPIDSIPKENKGYAVSLQWLIDNWSKWGYFDCLLDDVYILEGYQL